MLVGTAVYNVIHMDMYISICKFFLYSVFYVSPYFELDPLYKFETK